MDYYNRTDLSYKETVKNHILRPLVKIELLDEYENSYLEITQELSSEDSGAISSNLGQGVRQSADFSIFDPAGIFLPNPNDKYFWIGRKFKIYTGLSTRTYSEQANPLLYSGNKNQQVSSTDEPPEDISVIKVSDNSKTTQEDIYWFARGVYIITDISGSSSGGDRMVSITGVDKFGAFTNDTGFNEMVGTFSLPKGISIDKAIKEILNQDIGNGNKLDPAEPIIDPHYQSFTLPLDIDKGPGSYIGELLEDLANSLRADIYYDNDGHLNVWRTMDADEYKESVKQWDYYYGDQEYINNSINYKLTNVANSIYVVGDNPSASTLPQAWVENTNPKSPLSIGKIGRKTRYIESSTIQTNKEAKDYANYILKQNTMLGHTMSFDSTLIPHLKINDTITITDERYNYTQTNFIITSINYPIGLGTMSISASNAVELPEI